MKKKKIICLLLTLILAISCTTTALASETTMCSYSKEEVTQYFELMKDMAENTRKRTTVTLEKDDVYSDYRHIKITWEKVSDVTDYEIQIADNHLFKDATVKHRYPKTQLCGYWNFSLRTNIDGTYYIRVRPCFTYKINGEYLRVYGRWSNTIIADGKM